ncbi:helix-turn-helix transcriptional regulator [Altererythrobacter sp. Root672]|uniref:helix-turn-helix transcriptional regulator n=1 Tax=Altererythrobacter sp. Root672 TaxID=1736584 RepID=UPI0006F78EBB|nr:helix-turn-helix transcriptional regulator [Altererythrobacter sp. Root672]KRA79751.1 XRE family transcriptional regulator [Altererythrobacter sp. Root672]
MSARIYNRIAVFRAEVGMTRKALAEKVGVNPQTIGFLERGDYNPSLELALRVSQVFKVPIELLFSFTPFPSVAATLLGQESDDALQG